MFLTRKGLTKTVYIPKKASTAFTKGAAVAIGTGADNGLVIPATSVTGATRLMGIITRTVVSTDADYAANTKVPVVVPLEKNVEFVVDTAANTLSLANVRGQIGQEVDLTDSVTVNLEASSTTVALIRDVISTAKVTVVLKINGSY